MRQTTMIGFAATVALAACGGDGPDVVDGPDSAIIVTTSAPGATTPITASSDTTSTDTTSPPTTVAPALTTAPEPRVGNPRVELQQVVEVGQPVDLAVRPGDPAMYLVGQGGTITRYVAETGETSVVLDLQGFLAGGSEQGLLGLAFSPDGEFAYVNGTEASGTTVIVEFQPGADARFDPESAREVLRVEQPFSNHNAGDLEFGPDGMLYIPLGDGGSGGDPDRYADDPTSLLGSLLRIDPSPSDDGQAYTIPEDNPFATGSFDGVEGAPEVWAWGLRNPWKIAFDPLTGDLWIADVGQNEFEEINRVSPDGDATAGRGLFFGWSAFEGTEPFNSDVSPDGAVPPVLTYGRDDGCSVSGGVPYRGTAIAELEPAYVYSDFCGGTLWALDLAGGRVVTLLSGLDRVTAVRTGPDGEVYVLERTGGVHRLVPAGE
jgi:glucose/arabinose dehydrogenase